MDEKRLMSFVSGRIPYLTFVEFSFYQIFQLQKFNGQQRVTSRHEFLQQKKIETGACGFEFEILVVQKSKDNFRTLFRS